MTKFIILVFCFHLSLVTCEDEYQYPHFDFNTTCQSQEKAQISLSMFLCGVPADISYGLNGTNEPFDKIRECFHGLGGYVKDLIDSNANKSRLECFFNAKKGACKVFDMMVTQPDEFMQCIAMTNETRAYLHACESKFVEMMRILHLFAKLACVDFNDVKCQSDTALDILKMNHQCQRKTDHELDELIKQKTDYNNCIEKAEQHYEKMVIEEVKMTEFNECTQENNKPEYLNVDPEKECNFE